MHLDMSLMHVDMSLRPFPEPLSDPTGKSAAQVSAAMRKLNPVTHATAYQVLSTHPQPGSRLTSADASAPVCTGC